MYGYQGPPGWLPLGFQPRPPYLAMMNPSGYAPKGFRQAEIEEAFVHRSEADVVEVPTPTSNKRKKNAVTRTKLSNYSPDEDKNLVKSWLEISCDPITSTGRKRDRMWERIIQRYNSRRASNLERSLRSLQSRWDTIKAEVTLFASYYASTIRENPSGMSDADKTTRAVGNFTAVLRRKFGYLHCWELMKDAPKWQDPNARDMATAARGEGLEEASTAKGESSPVRSGAEASGPMGRDSAKAAKKKAYNDAGSMSSAEYAARMQDLKNSIIQEETVRKMDRFQQLASIDEKRFVEMRRHNEALLQIVQEKIRLMREKQEDERTKEEKKENERILAVDLDACTPKLRLYYQTLQEEILEKIAARRRRSQAP